MSGSSNNNEGELIKDETKSRSEGEVVSDQVDGNITEDREEEPLRFEDSTVSPLKTENVGQGCSSSSEPYYLTSEAMSFISCETNLDGYLSSEQLEQENQTLCRICHEIDIKDRFISPCKCKGTMSEVHRECLERWLAERDTNLCEICGFKFDTLRVPKYNIFKATYIWLTSEDTQRDRRDFMIDVIGFSLFAPIASTGTYVSFLLADVMDSIPPNDAYDADFNELFVMASGRMAMLTVISLLITFDVAYATWIAIRMQTHISNWYSWYRRNSMVTLLSSAPPATNTTHQHN